ncbi:hypothetical protein QE152_g7713 [Popillia japonica]|uniref:Uncharacterized protein n=1 Tax=Popillia japonica TaxID=7064 RepID=A0AAW1MCP0_POPJA
MNRLNCAYVVVSMCEGVYLQEVTPGVMEFGLVDGGKQALRIIFKQDLLYGDFVVVGVRDAATECNTSRISRDVALSYALRNKFRN